MPNPLLDHLNKDLTQAQRFYKGLGILLAHQVAEEQIELATTHDCIFCGPPYVRLLDMTEFAHEGLTSLGFHFDTDDGCWAFFT